ncbi:ketosynthase chain-length factor [Kutzneria viridogrisea]|uniref:Act minimal PKS chain-length factor (CLF/KS beta) n=1 Tax=Kutzneria viridogrisea TaxID=47990 RepID=A0ABR6BAF7_9PSEU|nr:act minimal PKS chain-length factor (CLF/KS beta) [Kutzneria viridogrisea]
MTAPVVTGIGVAAPNGIGTEEYWAAVLRGESGIRRITRFDPTDYTAALAGELIVDPAGRLPGRLVPQTDHMTQAALVVAEQALADAEVVTEDLPEYSAGVVTSASGGGFEFGQRELEALWHKGGKYVSAYQSFAWFYPVNTGQISIRHDLRGPSGAVVSEQAGGLDAVAKARRNLGVGARLMVAGGVDGSLCPWSWVCQLQSGRVSDRSDPKRAYVPFDAEASGWLPGEGGALLVLESPEAAAERDAGHRYGQILGYAATFDPRPGSDRPDGLRRCIELALADARVEPSEVDVVFADAAGVPAADRREAEVLAEVFGARQVPVTAPKTMTGRLLGGGAALDLATALLAMRDSVIPPTVHIDQFDHASLIDLVRTTPREQPLRTALVVARGFPGFNSAMVLRRPA